MEKFDYDKHTGFGKPNGGDVRCIDKEKKVCFVAMGQFKTEHEALERKARIEKFPFFIKTKDKVTIEKIKPKPWMGIIEYPFDVQVSTDRPDKFMT
jgi:hypothetical protein